MDFLIAGTMRSGSSSLYRNLGKHPDILTFEEKETGYFNNSFPLPQTDKLIGDGSVYCFTNWDIPGIIKDSGTKVIIILRHPYSRAVSHFWMNDRLDIKDNFSVISNSLYTRHIPHWLPSGPLFIKSEDYFEDTQREVDKVFDFLGIDRVGTNAWWYDNEYDYFEDKRLREFLRLENEGIEDMIGFTWW